MSYYWFFSQLEFQQSQNKKLEKELRRSGGGSSGGSAGGTEGENKYQQIAMQLVTDRQTILKALTVAKQRLVELEATLGDEQVKTKEMAEGIAALQTDRASEREQAQSQINQLEKANKDLQLRNSELESAIQKMDRQGGSAGMLSPRSQPSALPTKQTLSPAVPDLHEHTVKQRPPWASEGNTSPRKVQSPARPRSASSNKQEDTPTSSPATPAPPGHPASTPDNTTVFTTPSGTRISLNMKKSGLGRGTPPPLPPNKPHVVLRSPRPFTPEKKHPPQVSLYKWYDWASDLNIVQDLVSSLT